MEWKSFDSAPKDGRVVVVWFASMEMLELRAKWSERHKEWVWWNDDPCVGPCWSPFETCWKPTHWFEVTPPKSANESELSDGSTKTNPTN